MIAGSRLAVAVAGTLILGGLPAAPAPAAEPAAARPAAQVTQELRRAGVPLVLSPEDAARYRRIFVLQRRGDWDRAEAEIDQLRDPLLLGHVRYQKLMHPTAWRSSFAELSEWLAAYADHPGAHRVHRLARRRQGPEDAPPPEPLLIRRLGGYGADRHDLARQLGKTPAHRRFAESVLELVGNGEYDAALTRLHSGLIDLPDESTAQLEGRIAAGYYAQGSYWHAFTLAAGASISEEPGFAWIHLRAGLAALQLELAFSALEHFRQATVTPGTSWETAAGAYWAAHTYTLLGNPDDAAAMRRRAAEFPQTLYGQLALEELGEAPTGDWTNRRTVTLDAESALFARPEARRAIALVQAGRVHEADAEFRQLAGADGLATDTELLAFAAALDLPAVQLRLGSRLHRSGTSDLSALYPAAGWIHRAATEIDQALLHAIIRKESGFNVRAKSSLGARGLMQLLPRTGRSLTGDPHLRGPGADHLYDPDLNLRLGQRVLRDALGHPEIRQNLIGALVAYNAGARHWVAWQKELALDHPLLFIESIPLIETRWFVKRVLSNLWLYRDRFRQHKPSLVALSRGKWPRYVPLDSETEPEETVYHAGSR